MHSTMWVGLIQSIERQNSTIDWLPSSKREFCQQRILHLYLNCNISASFSSLQTWWPSDLNYSISSFCLPTLQILDLSDSKITWSNSLKKKNSLCRYKYLFINLYIYKSTYIERYYTQNTSKRLFLVTPQWGQPLITYKMKSTKINTI